MGAPRLLAPTTVSGGIPTAGAGTPNTVALWTPDGFTLGNSLLTQSGNLITNASGAIRASGTTQTSPAFTRHDTTTSGIYFPATNEIGFTISSQHAMFISSGRFVGINTTSPASVLHVRNNTAGITLDSTLGSGRQYQLNPMRTGTSNAGFEIRDVTASAAVISFDASQNVGIGTATPASLISTSSTVLAVAAPGGNLGTVRVSNTSNFTGNHAEFFAGTASVGIWGTSNCPMVFHTNNTERVKIDALGNVVINTAAIATNATNGFLYVPSCAGTPTGTPTTYTGRVPIVVDTTNNKLYFYSGGSWRDAGP